MIDAQPGEDGWTVPLAVTAALFDDPEAAETAYRTVKPLAERTAGLPAPHNPLWRDAARDGLTDPELREAAALCFAAALAALPRLGPRPRWSTGSPRSWTGTSPGAAAPPTTCSTPGARRTTGVRPLPARPPSIHPHGKDTPS